MFVITIIKMKANVVEDGLLHLADFHLELFGVILI